MSETAKTHHLRMQNLDFQRYIRGKILDIGCGDDIVQSPYGEATGWDVQDGDAQYLETIKSEVFDTVYSSHSLEHMVDVETSIKSWARVLKTGGTMFILIPDFDLYERGVYPSLRNSDHKHTFSINKTKSDVGRDNHYCVMTDLYKIFKKNKLKIREIKLEDYNFNYDKLHDLREPEFKNVCYQIVIVLKKNTRV